MILMPIGALSLRHSLGWTVMILMTKSLSLSLCPCISVSVFKHKIQLEAKSFVRSYRNSALSAKIS